MLALSRSWYFHSRIGFISSIIVGLSATIAGGQAPSSTSPILNDPKELLALASRSNSLFGPDIQPWHLKAKFQLLGANGKPPDEGIIEEFWAGSHKIRISYTSNNFAQTTYWTDSGAMQSGPAELPFYLMDELRAAIVEPMPSPEFLRTQEFNYKEQDLGGVKLECATAKITPLKNVETFQKTFGPTYCLNAEKTVLRIKIINFGMTQVLSNKISTFQGHYVPQDLRVIQDKKPIATLQVETLEAIKASDDSVFQPAAEAKPLPSGVTVSSGVATGMLLTKVSPRYPIEAKQSHTEGTVVLQALIGTDGKIADLKVTSGPLQLQAAATDAVRQWVYWPYFMNGQAVEVNTKINVVFNLGK